MLSAELRHPLRAFALDLALEVAPGECLALAGPSGAGKTSALRAIAGLLRALRTLLAEAGAPAILVTHDFAEAAVLADRVAVVERGQVRQEGDAATLAAEPRSAFVASFTGATTLRGSASLRADGLTAVVL